VEEKNEVSDGSLLLLVAFLLVTAPNCHLLLVLASVVQGDAVNCNTWLCNYCLRHQQWYLRSPRFWLFAFIVILLCFLQRSG